jgi:hypothetical protein
LLSDAGQFLLQLKEAKMGTSDLGSIEREQGVQAKKINTQP